MQFGISGFAINAMAKRYNMAIKKKTSLMEKKEFLSSTIEQN